MLSALLSMINDETDKELVRSLYEANEQLMYNVAYNILHNRTDAEDAVQDSFVSVINHLEKICEIDCNKTRFYLVIVEDEIISKISSDEIKNALRDLSDKDYEVMFLYLVKEHTPAEIAQLLGITGIQARQRIFRARHRLIRHLEKRGITNET